MSIPHLGDAFTVPSYISSTLCTSYFQTPNNGVFQEIVLAITMEDWLMGFMRILIRPHYVLHNRSKGPHSM